MNGETAWEITTDNCDEGILLNGDHLLLIDTYGISVYTLSSRTRLWGKTYITDKFRSQFVMSTNTVYLQSANTLTAFDVSTGNVQYTKTVPVGGDANIVYADGKIYEGTNDGCLICIDPNTGNKSWTFKTDGNLTGDLLPSAYTPAVGGGNIVFGAVDNKLYCLDESGNFKWKTSSVNLDYDDQPAITDNLVYVIDSYDRLRCFDIGTGNELWNLTGATNSLAASPIGAPILFNGKIFGMTTAASSNHQYYVFSIIPEFTSYIAILLFASATLLTVLLLQRKHRLCNARR
jgi:outer membrane protein assembly factor BamB